MYNYKGFTCAQDILIFLDTCREEEEQISKKLESMQIKLFDSNRKELKKERKELKEQLATIKAKIQRCLGIFEDATTFEKDVFLKFLAKYLSLKEREVYVLMDEVVEDDFGMAVATGRYHKSLIYGSLLDNSYMAVAMGVYPLDLFSKKYNIVASIHNKKRLENQGSTGSCGGHTDDIKDYLSVCKDGKYLCLRDDAFYSLLNGVKLKKSFSKYPYMHELAYDLVDMKIENPLMDDEERLNIILNNLQKKKKLPVNPNN